MIDINNTKVIKKDIFNLLIINLLDWIKIKISENKIKHFKKFDLSPETNIASGIKKKIILINNLFLKVKSLFK